MISVSLVGCPASLLSIYRKNFNVVIFSGTMNVINVKLCMMVVII